MTPSLPVVYTGLDIAKLTLELNLQGKSYSLANTPKGHAALVQRLKAIPGVHLVCEATGGYERAVVAALQAAEITVSVMNPARVRHFARAGGTHAKTDPIDAAVLTAFGAAMTPSPTLPRTPTELKLAAYVARRDQLIEMRTAESQRASACTDAVVGKSFASSLSFLERALAKIEREIRALVSELAELAEKVHRLVEIPGVGLITAVKVLAAIPELGTLTRGQAAALAGLAPYNRDSGQSEGDRQISGGRGQAREGLYMAALTASRSNPILKTFYDRLILKGKVPKVALTAVMRKLVTLMNHVLKNPTFSLEK